MIRYVLPLLAMLALAGCQPAAKPETNNAEPARQTTSGPTAADVSTGTTPEKPVPPSVPDVLKHAGYRFYGLDRIEPMRFRLTSSNGAISGEGTQTVRFDGIENGIARFSIDRTEALGQYIGNETVAVEREGVYLTGTTKGSFDKKALGLPADLAPGKTWERTSSITQPNGQVIKAVSRYRASAIEKVETPAGTFEAMKITSTETVDVSGKKGTVTSDVWYAENVGTVKLVSKVAMGSDPAVTLTIEAIP